MKGIFDGTLKWTEASILLIVLDKRWNIDSSFLLHNRHETSSITNL